MNLQRRQIMRPIDADALSAFVGDLRSTLFKEQGTFKAMTPIEFDTRDHMLLNFQQVIDNAPTVERPTELCKGCRFLKDCETCEEKLRPQGEWIPVSERLPDNETEVLFQYEYGQLMRVGYHIHDSTIYPFGYEDENETGWYDSEDNFICGSDEVIAWMPLPEPYKEAEK